MNMRVIDIDISLLLLTFYCIENMLVINCMSEKHESNKIENESIRVRESTFGGYRGNSPY